MQATPIPQRTSSTIDHLRVTGLTKSYGDRRVLDGIDLVVPRGARLGLIGENGVGKSTLLRLLGGTEEADAGSVARPARTGLLRQEVPLDATATIDDVLADALDAVRSIERELDDAASALAGAADIGGPVPVDLATRYDSALAAAERAEIWSVEARRGTILAGLGVDHLAPDRILSTISGGQRSRVALAALLLGRPDALLLDEPTNHLDDAAVAFLAAHLRSWTGPVLFASHDRSFLDEVATGLVDLDPALVQAGGTRTGPTVYGGGYSDYLVAKAAERRRWAERHAAEQEELGRLRESVAVTSRTINHDRPMKDRNKLSYDATANRVQQQISRRVRNARTRLDALTADQVRRPPEPLRFAGIPGGFQAQDDEAAAISMHGVHVADRLSIASLSVHPRARILITGANGAGKSTLLSVLAGMLRPDEGIVHRRPGTRVGLLEQDVVFADGQETPRGHFARALGERRAEVVPLSSLGLLPARDLDRPIGLLSVGQRRRLALALLVARPPQVLLLDEPTNHLSLALATEIEEALDTYPGAVVVASHDRWLRRRWTGEVVELEDGGIVP